MPDVTDSDLIHAYAHRRDESAFAELVARYAGLVYGVAARRVGASHADEVVQNTFAKLAKKSCELDSSRGLAAWLHRVAQGEAANAVRKEQRRNRAMERYAEQLDAPASDPELSPVLDEALVALGDAEQQLVMMRFFESLTFREIGDRLGTSEEAGRKRLARTLDKLAAAIGRRLGRTVPAASLAATLGVALTSEAPAAAIASASGVAAGAAGASTIEIVTFMKTSQVAFVSSLVLAAAVPMAAQWRAAAEAAGRASPPVADAAGGAEPAPRAHADPTLLAASAAFRDPGDGRLDLGRLAAAMAKIDGDGEPADLLVDLTAQMYALGSDDLAAVGELLRTAPNAADLGDLFDAFFSRWAEFDPRAALEATNDERWRQFAGNARIEAAQTWAAVDPDAAVEWCEAQAGDLFGSILKMCVFREWAIADPHAALAKAAELPPDRALSYRKTLVSVWVQHDPEGAMAWAQELEDETERTMMIEGVLENYSQQNAGRSVEMALAIEDPILRRATLRYAFMQWRFQPEESARGFLALPDADRTSDLAEDIVGWLRIEGPPSESPERVLRGWLAERDGGGAP